ncbi:unnamed protein product [Closterium sp. NIES-54]
MLQELKTALTRAGAPPEEQEGDAADWGRLRVGDEESGVVGMERDEGMREGEEARVLERRGAAAEFPVLLGVPVAVKHVNVCPLESSHACVAAGSDPRGRILHQSRRAARLPCTGLCVGDEGGRGACGGKRRHYHHTSFHSHSHVVPCLNCLLFTLPHLLPFLSPSPAHHLPHLLHYSPSRLEVPAAGQQQLLQQASVRWPSVSVPPSALSSPSPPILSSSSCPLRRPPTYFHPQFQIFSLLSLSSAAITPPSNPLAASQTCASISRPASFTATVGFKPSHHRLPASGCVSVSSPAQPSAPLFSPSPLHRHATHMALIRLALEYMAAACGRPGPRCVAVPEGPLLEQCEKGAAWEEFQQLLAQMRASSAWQVVSLPCLHDLEKIKESHLALMAFEYARFLDSLHLPDLPSLVSPALMELITTGRGVTEEEAAAGRASCVALRHALQQQLRQAGAQAFIAPAATGVPPPMHQGTTGDPIMSIPWSHAGLPTVTVPVALTPAAGASPGTAAAGSCNHSAATLTHEGGTAHECSSGECKREYLPLGVTLVGMWNEDEDLLDVAMDLEQFLDCTSPL